METKDDQLNRLQSQIQIQGDELRLLRGSSGDGSPHPQVDAAFKLAHRWIMESANCSLCVKQAAQSLRPKDAPSPALEYLRLPAGSA